MRVTQIGNRSFFVGGAGTNVHVFGLTQFARTLRTRLKLRVIPVKRDGFSETADTEGWQFQDYAQEVKEVLDQLEVERFRGIAICAGISRRGKMG